MEEFLKVGVITNTHGIKGEVKVFPTTDDINRFSDLKKVYLETKNTRLPMKISGVKYIGKMVVLKFQGLNDINEAQKLRDATLWVDRSQAVPLEDGEFFICDLVGMEVQTEEGSSLGVLKDVLLTGANDVYIVEQPDKTEILLPAISECVKKVDLENGVITVHVMAGLLD